MTQNQELSLLFILAGLCFFIAAVLKFRQASNPLAVRTRLQKQLKIARTPPVDVSSRAIRRLQSRIVLAAIVDLLACVLFLWTAFMYARKR